MEDEVIKIYQGDGDDSYWYALVQRSIEIGFKCENCGEQNTTTAHIEKRGKADPHDYMGTKIDKAYNMKERRAIKEKLRSDSAVGASTILLNAAERDMRNNLSAALLKHGIYIRSECKHCREIQSWMKDLEKARDKKEALSCAGCLLMPIAIFALGILVIAAAAFITTSVGSGSNSYILLLGLGVGVMLLVFKLISKAKSKIDLNIDSKTLNSNSRLNDPSYRPYIVTYEDNSET